MARGHGRSGQLLPIDPLARPVVCSPEHIRPRDRRHPVRLEPWSTAPDERAANEVLVADADGLRAVHLPVPAEEFASPRPRFDVVVGPVDGQGDRVDVVVSAHTPVRDFLLQADRLGPPAAADRKRRTLLPGERTRVRVGGCGPVDVQDVRAALFSVDVV
ncbi:hypothetical protein [Streptomyces sparsus]